MLQKLFKFESQQVLSKVTAGIGMPETKGKTDYIEKLPAQQRPAKRLKIPKTQEVSCNGVCILGLNCFLAELCAWDLTVFWQSCLMHFKAAVKKGSG